MGLWLLMGLLGSVCKLFKLTVIIIFSDIIELVSLAQFSSKESRKFILEKAVTKNDCLKFMLYAILELKGIEDKHFFSLAPKIEEVGKMLYGWQKNTK